MAAYLVLTKQADHGDPAQTPASVLPEKDHLGASTWANTLAASLVW